VVINKDDVPLPLLEDMMIIENKDYTVVGIMEQGATLVSLDVELKQKTRIGTGKISR